MEHKFKLEQDAGKFSETPWEYDAFRDKGESSRYQLLESLGVENPATPERHERLSKISIALNKSLSRYGLDSEPHDPSLIAWDPAYYPGRMADPWGALLVNKRDQVHIRLFLPQLTDDKETPKRIKDEEMGYTYAHELIHLYSARTWIAEEEENQKEERLSRIGLRFAKGKTSLWQWMNEAMVDGLTREEYPKIENYANPDNPLYEFYIQQFDAMIKALAKNASRDPNQDPAAVRDPAAIKEIFRSAGIGRGSLLPLRKVIRPPFRSLLEFIKITDSPVSFMFSADGTKKVFDKLWREIESGQTDTYLQIELKANEEKLLAMQELVEEALEILKSPKNKDYSGAKDKVKKLIENCEGFNWLLGDKRLATVTAFLESSDGDAEEPGKTREEAGMVRRILNTHFQGLPVLALMANRPEIKELVRSRDVSEIDINEVEKLYMKSLGVE